MADTASPPPPPTAATGAVIDKTPSTTADTVMADSSTKPVADNLGENVAVLSIDKTLAGKSSGQAINEAKGNAPTQEVEYIYKTFAFPDGTIKKLRKRMTLTAATDVRVGEAAKLGGHAAETAAPGQKNVALAAPTTAGPVIKATTAGPAVPKASAFSRFKSSVGNFRLGSKLKNQSRNQNNLDSAVSSPKASMTKMSSHISLDTTRTGTSASLAQPASTVAPTTATPGLVQQGVVTQTKSASTPGGSQPTLTPKPQVKKTPTKLDAGAGISGGASSGSRTGSGVKARKVGGRSGGIEEHSYIAPVVIVAAGAVGGGGGGGGGSNHHNHHNQDNHHDNRNHQVNADGQVISGPPPGQPTKPNTERATAIDEDGSLAVDQTGLLDIQTLETGEYIENYDADEHGDWEEDDDDTHGQMGNDTARNAENEAEGRNAAQNAQNETDSGNAAQNAQNETDGGNAAQNAENETDGGNAAQNAENETDGGNAAQNAENETDGGNAAQNAENEKDVTKANEDAKNVSDGERFGTLDQDSDADDDDGYDGYDGYDDGGDGGDGGE